MSDKVTRAPGVYLRIFPSRNGGTKHRMVLVQGDSVTDLRDLSILPLSWYEAQEGTWTFIQRDKDRNPQPEKEPL